MAVSTFTVSFSHHPLSSSRTFSLPPNNSFPSSTPGRIKNQHLNKNLCLTLQRSTTHNKPKGVNNPDISINIYMGELNMVNPYNRKLFSHKGMKYWPTLSRHEPRKHDAQQKKPDRKATFCMIPLRWSMFISFCHSCKPSVVLFQYFFLFTLVYFLRVIRPHYSFFLRNGIYKIMGLMTGSIFQIQH